jgi:hypothetical protein
MSADLSRQHTRIYQDANLGARLPLLERKKEIDEVDPSEKRVLVRHTSCADDLTFEAATI